MSVRRRASVSIVAVGALIVSMLAAASPAQAAATPLPFAGFSSVLADSHGHVYVTGGGGTTSVWVRNADGGANSSVAGQDGATGMVLSADGATLYVALADASAISAISTTTLTEVDRFATTDACPVDLALVGGSLWFTNNCGDSHLGKVTISSGVFELSTLAAAGVTITGIPGDSSSLVVGALGQSPIEVWRYATSGVALTQTAYHSGNDGAVGVQSNLRSMAIDPDGTHLVLACGAPYSHVRLALADLTVDGSYPSHNYPNAVATSTALGGLVAAGAAYTGEDDIWIYRAGSLVGSLDLGPGGLLDDGLSWAPDGSRLYAVSEDGLHVLTSAALARTTVTLTGPASLTRGSAVHLTGSVTTPGGPLAGVVLAVTRTDASGTAMLATATTGTDGSYVVDDTLGSTSATYDVAFAGDEAHGPATASATVAAVKAASILALSAPTTVARGHSYTLTGTLTSGGVAVPSATVTVTRTGLSGKRTLYLKISSTGRFSYKDVPTVGGPVAWTASWAGDADRSSVTAKRSVTVSRASTRVTITSDKSVYAYGGRAVVKVHLGTTYNNRAVAIYARKLNGGAARMVKAGKVNASGNLVVSLPVTVKTIYSVKFAGDYRYLPVGKARTVNVRAKVTVRMGGAYGRSGSGYRFRAGTNPDISVLVTPARPGGCVDLVAQRLNGSTWQTTSTLACAKLDFSSQAFATLFTNGGVGRGRMMASTGAGAFSSSGSSGWIYYSFS